MTISRLTKRSLIAFTLILIAASGAFASGAQEAVVPGGAADSAAFDVGRFSDLNASGIGELTIRHGDAPGVVVSGDSAYIDAVKVTNEAGYLSIVADGRNPLPVKVEIVTPDFDEMVLSGGTEAVISGWDMDHDFAVIMNDGASFETAGTLAVNDFYLYNESGDGGAIAIDADTAVIESNNGFIVMSGRADYAGATVTLDGEVSLQGLDIQSGRLTLANDGIVDADLPGISSVTVRTSDDAVATLAMNGVIMAAAYDDSEITANGDIATRMLTEADDSDVDIS